MFGRNKKKNPSKLARIVSSNIENSIIHEREMPEEPNFMYLPRGMENDDIPSHQLDQLSVHLKRKWKWLNLKYLFPEEPEPIEIPAKPEPPVMLKNLSEDSINQIKAVTLGELKKIEPEEPEEKESFKMWDGKTKDDSFDDFLKQKKSDNVCDDL